MSSLVLELQRESYENTVSISTLLRKAYIVAKKLKVKEFEDWLDSELNGYNKQNNKVPEYRNISGVIKAWNPYCGWIPTLMNNQDIYNALTNRVMKQPITELESLLNNDGQISMLFPNPIEMELSKMGDFETEFRLFISNSQLEKIIGTVRNIVLKWSLKLEEDGIVGEEMSFSEKEKETANKNEYIVNNFYGNVNNSQIQQNTTNSNQGVINETVDINKVQELMDLIKSNLKKIDLTSEKEAEIEIKIDTIKSQLDSSKPQNSIIRECFSTIKNILEGTAGSIIASGLLYKLGLFLN